MARFVVLKGGQSHTVFEFDGNIARVGAGDATDLRLEGTRHEGDFFFLTRNGEAYELERRARDLQYTVNGQPGGDRVTLKDGDKISFEDFMIIVTYPPTLGQTPKEQLPFSTELPPEPEPEHPVSRDTAAVMPREEAEPDPIKKPAGSERETTLIDVDELERRSKANAEQPLEDRSKQDQPKRPLPQQPPPRGGSRETQIIDSSALEASRGQQPATQRRTEPPKARPVESPPAESKSKKRIRAEYSLVGLAGQYKGRAQEIDTAEYVIGRDPRKAELVIDRNEKGELEKSISREHFVIISSEDGLLYLIDKKSKLRTYINGRVIEPNQRESIAPEDIISIPAPSGEVIFRLCYRGQENYEPIKKSGMLVPALILLAVIVVLIIVLLILLHGE